MSRVSWVSLGEQGEPGEPGEQNPNQSSLFLFRSITCMYSTDIKDCN